jgi:hypothetical protein
LEQTTGGSDQWRGCQQQDSYRKEAGKARVRVILMPDPAEEWRFSLSDETWYKIQSRIHEAEARMQRAIAWGPAWLGEPDPGKLTDIHTACALGLLAAHAIPSLDKVFHPRDLAPFLQYLDWVRRWLFDLRIPIMTEFIRDACHEEAAADFECRCEMLVDADFTGWRSAAELMIAEQAKHSQGSIVEIANSGIFRLSSDPSSEPSEYPVNGDIRRVNVPDSAMEEKKHAQAERAKARQAVVGPILEQKRWLIHQWAAASNVNYKTARDYWNGKNTPRNDTRSDLAKSLGISSDRGIFPD